MPPPVAGSVTLDILKEVKEMQLQHGLRNEDFARYHKYLTRRLHTLRCQLNMSNNKSKYMNKKVTANNATTSSHVLMLVIEAERAWAGAEESRAKISTDVSGEDGKAAPGPSTASLRHHVQNRMNKAESYGNQLVDVVKAIGVQRLQIEGQAYAAELSGRNSQSRQDYESARDSFRASRDLYYSLHKVAQQPEQWSLVIAKIQECDDRVVYSMQRLGQDTQQYNPPMDATTSGSGGQERDAAAEVQWLDRPLTVESVKVKELLREVKSVTKLRDEFAAGRDCVSGISAQPKLLEHYDRLIGLFNDAIAHTQQDIKDNATRDRVQTQLLEHYLRFQLHSVTLKRTHFLVEVYIRRYWLTQASKNKDAGLPMLLSPSMSVLTSSNGSIDAKAFDPQYAASPLEIVNLYTQAIEHVTKMLVLPGVEDNEVVGTETNDELLLCKAGRMLFHGEGWLIADNITVALGAFKHVELLLREVQSAEGKQRSVAVLSAARVGVTRIAVRPYLASTRSGASAGASKVALADASGKEFTPCKSFVRLPPDYQSVPCKPVFVDVASTFVDLPPVGAKAQAAHVPAAKHVDPSARTSAAKREAPAVPKHVQDQQNEQQQGEGGDDPKKGWFSGWGWGKKK